MPEKEPTKAEVVEAMTAQVVKTKAWARSKAGTIQRALDDNGGEPSKAMKKALAALVAEAGEIGPDDMLLAEKVQAGTVKN